MVFRTGLLDHADAGDIGWSRVPLGELHGEQLGGRAGRRPGSRCVLRARSTGSSRHGRRTATGRRRRRRRLEADAVIVATPPEVAAGLLGEGVLGPRRAARGLADRERAPRPRPPGHRPDDVRLRRLAGAVRLRPDRVGALRGPEAREGEQCLSISLSGADDYIGRRPEELISSLPRGPGRRPARGRDGRARRRRGLARAGGHLPRGAGHGGAPRPGDHRGRARLRGRGVVRTPVGRRRWRARSAAGSAAAEAALARLGCPLEARRRARRRWRRERARAGAAPRRPWPGPAALVRRRSTTRSDASSPSCASRRCTTWPAGARASGPRWP